MNNGRQRSKSTRQTRASSTTRHARRATDKARRWRRSWCSRRSRQEWSTAPVMEVRNMSLVTQRKTLEQVEPVRAIRWLLRHYFAWRGFACRSHCGECDGSCYASIEYRGVFDDEGMAYHAARCDGGAVKPIPFNCALPEETVAYRAGDVPMSEASAWYRRGVMLPFEAVPRSGIDRLREKIRETDPIVEGFRAKIA